MHTETVKFAKTEALTLYRRYKEHSHYSTPIDQEIQRAYQLIAAGKVIIKALESIKQAGLDREFLPKLAMAPATARACHLRRNNDGSMVMSPDGNFYSERRSNLHFAQETFVFPAESFPITAYDRTRRHSSTQHEALMPVIPIHLRPKRGLANYHVLWEAEWHRAVPSDPMLLRRIGKADLWLVVAAWELTEVEKAALSTRI